MAEEIREFLKNRLPQDQLAKLLAIDNPALHAFVARYVELCAPDRVFVCDDSDADAAHVRNAAVEGREETPLAIKGHTYHFDGYFDQARDKNRTRFLVGPGDEVPGEDVGEGVSSIAKDEGLAELERLLSGIMKGKQLFVRFFCLGPTGSKFAIPCVQLTDSAYVAHSEDLLYRRGHAEFVRQGRGARFFKFIHSAGELDDRRTSVNVKDRRVYIDCPDSTVYSVNTQYGGNTIGLKKLAMRLAIYRAAREGWLTEHKLVMGIKGPGRITYVTGAFPSMCGKTSTAMIPWETMIGDDIAYLRADNGEVRAVNVESGMFGIIMGINRQDDPLIWETLHSPGEVIFSNILISDKLRPYWLGMGEDIPGSGINHSGNWTAGKKDDSGAEVTPSHKNARFTVALKSLKNTDPRLDDPSGVRIDALIYGGRDSDTWVPVVQAFDWNHGIVAKAAALESETTAATLGKEGKRAFNPMSNIDFVSIPLGKYIEINLDFGKKLASPPSIFGFNYFIRDRAGKFLNERNDKAVWLKWVERRVHSDVKARKTPTGFIPLCEDLTRLFKEVLNKSFTQQDYVAQFTLRIPENLAKIDRIEKIYRNVPDCPPILFEVLQAERKRLEETRSAMGDYVEPDNFPVV